DDPYADRLFGPGQSRQPCNQRGSEDRGCGQGSHGAKAANHMFSSQQDLLSEHFSPPILLGQFRTPSHKAVALTPRVYPTPSLSSQMNRGRAPYSPSSSGFSGRAAGSNQSPAAPYKISPPAN